jgi:hypothetical protein
VTDGPFAETNDLIAGWMVIDVDSHEQAIELAGELSAAPGPAGSRSTSGYRDVTRRHVMYVVTSIPSTCVVGVLKIAKSPSKVT